MSVNVDYFCDSSLDLTSLARAVDDAVGSSLVWCDGDPPFYETWFMGLEFSLGENEGLLDDGNLDHSSFGYQVGTRSRGIPEMVLELPVMVGVAHRLQVVLGVGGILVFDGQILLARYERRGSPEQGHGASPFVDALSGTSPDYFGEHLAAVGRRLGSSNPLVR